ncbi:hypothetical protein MUK42_34522 [Musa troglodytarum]|uniref:Uncharacterized protein n=1 Tax=Musa troglodytarum TaxID=320322 RepID=A0A9E7F3Z8_9LILI|nr:hypothetical protein MUK42_34522 [Musa troglodytarum]
MDQARDVDHPKRRENERGGKGKRPREAMSKQEAFPLRGMLSGSRQLWKRPRTRLHPPQSQLPSPPTQW